MIKCLKCFIGRKWYSQKCVSEGYQVNMEHEILTQLCKFSYINRFSIVRLQSTLSDLCGIELLTYRAIYHMNILMPGPF